MKRYIDTDILAKIVFDKWQECDELKYILPAVRNAVMNASTIDVVEIVRCKDCEYFDQAEKYCCDFLTAEEDGFCKWGKRREDEKSTKRTD